MKKVMILLIMICCFFIMGVGVKADSNMDGGGSGGGTQSGTAENNFVPGDDGVRVTIIDINTKCRALGTKSFDYYRMNNKEGKLIVHFGKICKVEYMGAGGYVIGRNLIQSMETYLANSDGERVAFLKSDLPTIVSNSMENSDIDEIKNYFNTENVLKSIASKAGISYENMISGKYKVLIEPMIYLTFQGNYIAMTAHEAAKLDIAMGGTTTSGGALRAKFVSFTHKNLPLSVFLEKKDLGIRPWTGSKYGRVHNGSILAYLGIGILSFAPEGNEVDLDGNSYKYRPNTDVITAVEVSVTDGDEDGASCDNPITVRFSGEYITTTDITGVTIPLGGSRLVWIKWRTPSTDSKITTSISATITKGGTNTASVSVPITIAPLSIKEPENPTADDKKPVGWTGKEQPTFPTTAVLAQYTQPIEALTWYTYTCTKRSYISDYYEDDEGKQVPIYDIEYEYSKNIYSGKINSTNVKVTRDRNTSEANTDKSRTKSGYGIELEVTSNVVGSSSSTTGVQSFCAYFPEYAYKKYRRDGVNPGAKLLDTVELPVNLYSLKKNRIHFTPIWFPDGNYEVYVETFDAWTPAGMLCSVGTGAIELKGSMWDDWYIQTVRS